MRMAHSLQTIMPEKILPEAFVARIKGQRPDDADDFLRAISGDPWLSIRTNPFKPQESHLPVAMGDAVPWCSDGNYLNDRPLFTLIPQFHGGAFYVQEASSMSLSVALSVVTPLLPPHPTCLDLCAAPGGKATLLLSRIGQQGIVVANEVVRQRAWILRENIAKWGAPSAIVTNKKPDEIAASGVTFDLITVDAPCSGEGMFRKDQTAIDEWSPKAAADCATRQREILTSIWPALKTGGFLIYSTCTYNPDENERNVEWMVNELGAEIIKLHIPEGFGIETLQTSTGEAYAFYPHKVKGEGLFICLLRKVEDTIPQRPDTKKKGLQRIEIKESKQGTEYTNGLKVYLKGDELIGLPATLASAMTEVTKALSPLMAGVPIGTVLKKNGASVFTPAPELPLSAAFKSGSIPEVNLPEQQALKFLHGDSDLLLPDDAPDGWLVISHEGLRLGLVKVIGKRLNNYYPKEWRIKMNINR